MPFAFPISNGMDTLSHGLWGSIAFGRKNKRQFWLAFITGIAPDALSFGIFLTLSFLGFMEHPPFDSANGPIAYAIPDFVHNLYSLTHSFVSFAVVAALLYLMIRKVPIWLFAWPLHIIVDIGTHSKEFFPTPFLWPVSDYTFDGINWGNPYIFFPNVALLLILYIWYWYRKAKDKKRAQALQKSFNL